jgi:nicotinate-nucleotide--dimethylbenzimidazole phosphoribosyltransferase
VGGMLQAAQERRIIVVDGFVSAAAALVAKSLSPGVVDYMVFSHQADNAKHQHLLKALGGKPLMQLDLSIDEGVGALLAWPLVQSAAKFLNEMGSQDSSATKPGAAA